MLLRSTIYQVHTTCGCESIMHTFFLHRYKENLADEEMFVLPDPLLPEDISWVQSQWKIVAVLSTKKLLRNAILQQDSSQPSFVSVDGTYSLLANGWPTLVVGTIDWHHKFCLIGIAVSSNEDEECFEAALQSLSKGDFASQIMCMCSCYKTCQLHAA